MRTIYHQFHQKDFYSPTWSVKYLFLGTFNPLAGQEVNYYYGRERNKTWELLSKVFGKNFDTSDFSTFRILIEESEIACMDLIHSVKSPEERVPKILGKGYSDSEIVNKSVIREYNTDKILEVLRANKGVQVYSTWGKGPSLKEWKSEVAEIAKETKIVPLVSPSMVAKVPKGQKKFDYMCANWCDNVRLL